MKSRSLYVPNYLANDLKKLHPTIKKKIRAALDEILDEPYSGKALKDELAGLYSYRVARYRIIYKVINKKIHLITVGPRKNIYIETFSLIKKEKKQ
jgi:mRNA interferase RelE/StbE